MIPIRPATKRSTLARSGTEAGPVSLRARNWLGALSYQPSFCVKVHAIAVEPPKLQPQKHFRSYHRLLTRAAQKDPPSRDPVGAVCANCENALTATESAPRIGNTTGHSSGTSASPVESLAQIPGARYAPRTAKRPQSSRRYRGIGARRP